MSLTKATYSMIKGAPANVLDFGAIGDGVADDTAAIQAAIDSVATGGTVYFPSGVYEVSSSILLDGVDGVCLRGDGFASHIRAKVFNSYPTPIQATQGVITIGGTTASSNIIIENLKIDAQGGSQPVDPGDPDGEFNTLSLRSCSYITMKNVYLAEGARDTLYLAGKAATGAASDIHHLYFEDLVVEGSANRRAFSFVDACEDVVVNNVIIEGNSNGTALAFEPGSGKRKVNRITINNVLINGGTSSVLMTAVNDPPEDIQISNLICRGSTGAAINLSRYKRVQFSNVNIISSGGSGLETGTVSASCQDLFLNNILVQDSAARGIWLRSAHNVYGNGITIRSAASASFHISGASASEFSKNVNVTNVDVIDGTSNGILMDSYCTQIALTNIRVVNNGSDGVMFSSPLNTAFEAILNGGYVADNNGSGVRSNFPAAFSGAVLIQGIRSTNTPSGNTQAYGVELDADADYVRLLGCDLRGNGTGSITGSVGANGINANNIT